MDLDVVSPPTVKDIIDNAKEKLTELKLNLLEVKRLVKNLDEVSKPLGDNAVSSAMSDIQLDVEPAASIDTLMANFPVGSLRLPTPSIYSSNKADSISKRPRKWWCFRKKKPRVLSESGKPSLSVGKKDNKKKQKIKLYVNASSAELAESEHKLELLNQFTNKCTSERNPQQSISLKRKDDDKPTTMINLMDEILKEIPQFG